MQTSSQPKAIVIGAGILGLAYARSLRLAGFTVDVFERSAKASGSSIRNFGMVWPIGQPKGTMLDRAMRTRDIWINICKSANIWHKQTGSVQLLSNILELELGKEFIERENPHRPKLQLLNKEQTLSVLPIAHKQNTHGSIYSGTEIIVEAREAIRLIPEYFAEQLGIRFHFNTTVTEVQSHRIKTSTKKTYEADVIVICSGYEINLLFPEVYTAAPITISQLNMLRSTRISQTIPAVCAGLSFLHYGSYEKLPSSAIYKKWVTDNYPAQHYHGIHLLISQNYTNQLTIGDSHDYGQHHDPFQSNDVDQYIIDYLNDVLDIPNLSIAQRWTGQYLKLTNGKSEWFEQIEKGVFIANGPGGAGMTLGFGMAEDTISQMIG
jgi:FAD dependent oxidoreductase TIGR03364